MMAGLTANAPNHSLPCGVGVVEDIFAFGA
jgi:hypothetical protein